MSGWEGFAWGVLGGAFGELLGWFRLRQMASLPGFWRSPLYWLLTAAMFMTGGALVVAYMRSGVEIKPILAINIGASAPLLIQSFVAQTPPIPPGKVD